MIVVSVAMVAALAGIAIAIRAANETTNKLYQVGPASLGITEHDFAITPDETSVPAGRVDLHVTNTGPSSHELIVFQTDLAPDKLPLGADGRVDEAGDGVMRVFGSGATINAGTSKTFHTALAAGHYVMICNLPGHYQSGMRTAFTVSGPAEAPTIAPTAG